MKREYKPVAGTQKQLDRGADALPRIALFFVRRNVHNVAAPLPH
ncbi:hypothetical protein [Xanthomonas vasicola]|nr:hypothetical protein [Xanthomonas vasicola]